MMLQFGPLAFAQPWILAAMAALPLIWWLLRVTPPAPRSLTFPAIRLLLGLQPPEETPAHTPWWLLLLRLMIAALIIAGLAGPLLNPVARLAGDGPLVLVIDDGWAAARHWRGRQAILEGLLAQAEREGRPVAVLTTAPNRFDAPIAVSGLLTAAEARRQVQGLEPKPWPVDRPAAIAALKDLRLDRAAHVFWLSNGLEDGHGRALAARLRDLGRLDVLRDLGSALPHLILPPESDGLGITLRLARAGTSGAERLAVLARAEDGGLVARTEVSFAEGEDRAQAPLTLPLELRNRIARLTIAGEDQAGAVLLLDERWRRRPVGLVSGSSLDGAQPLLSELYYLERALSPFTELSQGEVGELLDRKLSVIALPDAGSLPAQDRDGLTAWIERGGLLLRFAGPRLAENVGDRLLPVPLRGGGRALGGVMTWDRPARLAAFDPEGPFAGLVVPNDVVVNRQVLAEPTLDLGDKTWARLSDGTPLVTADRRGDGWVVLVHTTANNDWSNLALSGLFVDLLRRIVAVSQGVKGEAQTGEALAPVETLDGFGRLGAPPTGALAAAPKVLEDGAIGPRHPPGYYGSDATRRALNLAAAVPDLAPLTDLPSGIEVGDYATSGETDIKPWLLTLALVLALADWLVSLALRGLLTRTVGRGAALVLLIALWLPDPAAAQDGPQSFSPLRGISASDSFALEATLETRLAYVLTGVAEIDRVSQAGLIGLSRVLVRRTSIEAGTPMGVDLEADELAFFPLLYWPVTDQQPRLSALARRKVNHYIDNGGTILFDLREASAGARIFGRASRGSTALQGLTQGIEIPPLTPVPPDHVLTKAFYLMQDFPGRYAGAALWVGATEGRVNDGVASIMVGSNDYAGAWAVSDEGRPLFPVVPGGERQREMSYRAGVNLVMYALTGNYKADQVHVPFILERLGQ